MTPTPNFMENFKEKRRRTIDCADARRVPEPDPCHAAPCHADLSMNIPGIDGRLATATGDSRSDKREIERVTDEIHDSIADDIADVGDLALDW